MKIFHRISVNSSSDVQRDALWLALVPDWHHGYPQPAEDVFGYLQATYDLANYCDRCGVGLIQKAHFQMTSEPKWGKRSILQLNWVFDEFFATPEVWQDVFEPLGVASRPVLGPNGRELQTVVQLVVRAEAEIRTDGLQTEEDFCARCGQTKYLPVVRGHFPRIVCDPLDHMVKTQVTFGSGASAFREVLVSQALGRVLVTNKVRGASLKPVAL